MPQYHGGAVLRDEIKQPGDSLSVSDLASHAEQEGSDRGPADEPVGPVGHTTALADSKARSA
jgi:hypothetical protein